MSAQEKAGLRALARHSQRKGIRDGQIHCVCGWKTQTTGQLSQQKSFRRHQIREVLAAAKKADAPVEITTVEQLEALPVESVVRSFVGVAYERDEMYGEDHEPSRFWSSMGSSDPYNSAMISLPAILLSLPDAS